MVMEPNQQVDGSQTKIDYPKDSQIEFQHSQDNNLRAKSQMNKMDSTDGKGFQPTSNGPEAPHMDQFKTAQQNRPFGYNDNAARPMYPEGMMLPSGDPYPAPSGPMSSASNTTNNTPTLNQLLTQTPTPQKYPPGYGDYPAANSGAPTGAPNSYEGWNSAQQQPGAAMPSNAARPAMPVPTRPMAGSGQMAGNMYDRTGMHAGYRHPNSQYAGPGNPGYPRMMGYPQQPNMEAGQGGDGEMDAAAQQRMRAMMGPGRMMGPPRPPGPHQVDSGGGQMMPPPNQAQGYPGMYPYGGQPYRNTPVPPYANYPANQMARSTPQQGFNSGPMNQHQANGPTAHKPMPQSPGQPSPGGASMRGISPSPNQPVNVPASPAGSTSGQTKAASPCPSPSVSSHRSMPPSPAAAQLNSPHPGLSPRPESVSSPRTDPGSLKQEQNTSLATSTQNLNQTRGNAANQSDAGQKADTAQSPAVQTSMQGQSAPLPAQGQHMMPPQQMRMSTGMANQQPHPQAPVMGNGMAHYSQRMPVPGQYQQPGMAYPPGAGPQYPSHNQQQMGYGSAMPGPQGWQQGQQMAPSLPNAGPVYQMKNDKGAVPSPLSATQSPSAVASPHGSEGGRRPSSRKSSDAGSSKTQKSAANSVHGTSLDIVNKQVDMGPAQEAQPRRHFMEHICQFYFETSKPLSTNPCIGKNPLDLYKVYTMVKEKGGFQQMCKKKLWKQVGSATAATTAANAAYTLKKAYMKFLLNYECKFDLGGADPQTIINSVETKKERQNRNAPSPAGSGNSQDAHMRNFPDYPMGPGGVPTHPAHMGGGAQMRPGQFHDPNMPSHQQQNPYMNYNNMGGPAAAAGLPNGHHPMPPHQSSMEEHQQMSSSQADPNSDAYQQMNSSQYTQQPMSAPGYQSRHPYYGPRMPPPGAQRPPFHQQQSTGGGPPSQQQQPGIPPGSQMRMPPQPQSSYHPMYRDPNSFITKSAGPASSTSHIGGYPPMSGQPEMAANPASSAFAQSSAPGVNQSQISASSNMTQPMQHSSPVAPMARYPTPHRPAYQTPTRGALSAMLSNSASMIGLDNTLSLPSFADSLVGEGALEMPPPPLPVMVDVAGLANHHDARSSPGQQWRPRGPMAPPGYPQEMPRRQLPMPRSSAPQKKDVVFPAGCVESGPMKMTPRRLLQTKHIGKLMGEKLVMCLCSGQLCELSWALDAITVYLQDEMTAAYFSLDKRPAAVIFDSLISHYKRSLAEVFEELSDLVEASVEDIPPSPEAEEEEDDGVSECKHVMLDGANYSWSSRAGLKVIVDTELKKGHMIPSVSMYNRKLFVSHKKDRTTVDAHETNRMSELYRQQFGPLRSSCPSSAADGEEPVETAEVDNKDSQLLGAPVCNGCVSYDTPVENSEHSCETADTATAAATDGKVIKSEVNGDTGGDSLIDRKVAESAQDLKDLEAKLRLSRKRRFSEQIDVEPIVRDEPPLETDVDARLEEISIRCLTIGNILRGFSFLPGNEKIMAVKTELIHVLGRLLNVKTRLEACEETTRNWWWSALELLREHTLVTVSNIAGHIQLIDVSHEVCFPLLDSLLFWSTTNAAYARDPLPNAHSLSIRNLTMEILCKLCAHSDNMNLLLSTPPTERLFSLFQCLAKLLCEPDQVRREFALVIVSCLAQADPMAARGLAIQNSCVSQLISILESAESAALSIAQQRGVGALRDRPEAMGTSLDMIRRTSATLVEMAQVEGNHSILLKQQDRLLNLVMSQILDQHVAKMLSDVLFECTKNSEVSIAPSYVISAQPAADVDQTELERDDPVKTEPMDEVEGNDYKDVLKVAEVSPELDKENINKPSSIETNNKMGMISAAS